MSAIADRLAGAAPCELGDGGGIVRPRAVEELVEVARIFRNEEVPLGVRAAPAGPPWAAHPGREPPWTLCLGDLAGEPEVEPLDLVLSAGAGCPLARAREAARAHGLDLPLEEGPCGPATLGGLLARGEGRGARLAPAGPRGVLLGLTAVLPDGRAIRGGGRVVKNVAGTDTHRLFVGSMGTLGAIASVHLKLVPLPGGEELVRWEGSLPSLIARARSILGSLAPIEAIWIEAKLPDDGTARLRARLRGVVARLAFLRDRIHERSPGFAMEPPRDPAFVRGASLLRARVAPGLLGEIVGAWEKALAGAGARGALRIHPDAGEIWLGCEEEASRPLAERLAREAFACGGTYFEAWRSDSATGPAWAPEADSHRIWRALKERLDPKHRWNPAIVLSR